MLSFVTISYYYELYRGVEIVVVNRNVFGIQSIVVFKDEIGDSDLAHINGIRLSLLRPLVKAIVVSILAVFGPLAAAYSPLQSMLYRSVDVLILALVCLISVGSALFFYEYSTNRLGYILALRRQPNDQLKLAKILVEKDFESIVVSQNSLWSLSVLACALSMMLIVLGESVYALVFSNQVWSFYFVVLLD